MPVASTERTVTIPVIGWGTACRLPQAFSDRASVQRQREAVTSRYQWCSAGASAVLAFVVGTGGLMTPDYIVDRDRKGGYRFPTFEYRDQISRRLRTASPRRPAQNLARIREFFRPTVTDLAALFGVSRQAIYNWQAGEPIAQQNEERLEQLAWAADFLDSQGIAEGSSSMRRKLTKGRSFFDLVREGQPATEVAAMLVSLIRKEAAQRAAISSRLAARARKPIDAGDIGAPHLDERA